MIVLALFALFNLAYAAAIPLGGPIVNGRATNTTANDTSTFVYYDNNGNLQYKSDTNGNRIMDFSHAGYGGGGVAIPGPDVVPVQVTLTPSNGGDDTSAIQKALSNVSSLPLAENGFRGAVVLGPGNFKVSKTLQIGSSGVVLRGSGSGSNGTVITMSGGAFLLISVSGSGSISSSNENVAMIDKYVPSGVTSFTIGVIDGRPFAVGDTILIHRPVTEAWIELLGMNTLVRDGKPQTWMSSGSTIATDRVITNITNNINNTVITIDAPLTDSFDSSVMTPASGTVSTYTFPGRISNVGIESFSVVAPGTLTGTDYYQAIDMNNLIDSWMRDVNIQDTENSIVLNRNAKRVTLDNVQIKHTFTQPDAAAPADFTFVGTQLLANKCSVLGKGSTWPFITQDGVTGPNVFLKCLAEDNGVAPHQRWSTGLLSDNCNVSSVAYMNRGYDGSGQGWTTAWSVAWNVVSQTFVVQNPPGASNWVIGGSGQETSKAAPGIKGNVPNGNFELVGTQVTPGSLYLAQLKQRLGSGALEAIGYTDANGN
jgi:hypothetical protein